MSKLLLTVVGYAQVTVVAEAIQPSDPSCSPPPISASAHNAAVILQQALQYIPNPGTECMLRNMAVRLAGHLSSLVSFINNTFCTWLNISYHRVKFSAKFGICSVKSNLYCILVTSDCICWNVKHSPNADWIEILCANWLAIQWILPLPAGAAQMTSLNSTYLQDCVHLFWFLVVCSCKVLILYHSNHHNCGIFGRNARWHACHYIIRTIATVNRKTYLKAYLLNRHQR